MKAFNMSSKFDLMDVDFKAFSQDKNIKTIYNHN